MKKAVGVWLIEGRQRTADMRRLAIAEITPEQLQRENSITMMERVRLL